MDSNLTDREYWEKSYIEHAPRLATIEDEVALWIREHCPPGTGRVLEIGCFPGQYLTVFGELGYELNGIDLVPRVEDEVPSFLKNSGFRVGEFAAVDLNQWEPPSKFDIVCSFGLIEHFRNWPEILERHCELIAPGGMLMLTAPNFRKGIQRPLHAWLDKENVKKHNLPAMNPTAWAKQATALGFKIVWKGYFGKYDFWFGDESRSKLQKEALRTLRKLRPHLRKLPPGRAAYSPFCGLVAVKEQA
jgi:2-polyprenyl-3-methyl-5-hydroxy-6-metoxy-1,4-benzoquinol methylase